MRNLILDYNHEIFQQFHTKIQTCCSNKNLRSLLAPYTMHTPNKSGQIHYGYENLDGLLEGLLTPQPLPKPTLDRTYGMVRYEPTPSSVILELVDQIEFSKDDVFFDLGSGLGKVVALVSLLAGVPCVGVEIEPSYCDYAAQRAADLGLKYVQYINDDAQKHNYENGTIFFLFNPFGGKIFDTVLENLHLESSKRQITICSYGSCTAPIVELPWLQITDIECNHEFKLAIFISQT